MYHDTAYEVRRDNIVFRFCDDITRKAKNMYNVANYYIRNVMTGVKKDKPSKNEEEVLKAVNDAIPKINAITEKPKHKKGKAVKKAKKLECPTEERWMLSYKVLDGLFKVTDNPDYRAMPIQVSQNAIKECVAVWESYFKALKAYKKSPASFTGKPKPPKYKKKDHASAVIGNQLAYIKDGILHLPGKNIFDISGYVPKGKLIEVRISPYYGGYAIHVITDDGIETSKMSKKKGVMMIDPGLTNFVTAVDNRGGVPFIVKGGFLKSRNQWFNKMKAKLVSALTKGKDPKESHCPMTKRLNSLSKKRDRFLRDCFYKISHRIAREAISSDCGKVVIGRNVFEKQEINIGHVNNQAFVSIPFYKFTETLKTVCLKYGIEVIEQEESYTSKASALDKDKIPTYKKGDDKKYSFSGRRVKRGLYRSKDGIKFNADVNGGMNIGRKYNPWVFAKTKSFDTITQKIEVLGFKDFYKKKSNPGKAG